MAVLDIRSLQHLLGVIDEGSVGQAARRVNLSQPALSKSIRQLELRLGVPLFERASHGMRATRFGIALAERARVIVREAAQAAEEIDEMCGRRGGAVLVCASPSIAAAPLAEAVAALVTRRPAVRVTVHEGLLADHMPLLLNGTADFVIGTAVEALPEDLVSERLFRDTVAVFARTGHPLAGRGTLPLGALAPYAFAVARAPDGLRGMLERHFAAAGQSVPRQITEANSLQFMKALLLRTDALAYLPRLACAMEDAAGLLVPLDVPEAGGVREVELLRRARGSLSAAAKELLAELRAVCTRIDATASGSVSAPAGRERVGVRARERGETARRPAGDTADNVAQRRRSIAR